MSNTPNDPSMIASSTTGLTRPARQVIALLRQNQRMSRTRMAKAVGVTRAAMAQTINALLEQQIVQSSSMVKYSQGGRPAESLELTGQGFVAIGIHLDTHIKIVVTDAVHQVLAQTQFPNHFEEHGENDAKPIDQLIDTIRKLLDDHQISSEIIGIGFCVVGYVSPDGSESSPNMMTSSKQATLCRNRLSQAFDCSVCYVNNTAAPLLTERWMADDLPENPSLLYVDEGLGYSLYVQGQLFCGPADSNHWLGRFQIDQHGAIWDGGLPGLLAATASMTSITDTLAGYTFGTRPHVHANQLDKEIKQAFERFENHDAKVIHLFDRAFDHLGFVLRNLTVLFGPQLIILDGWTPTILEHGIKRVQHILDEGKYDSKATMTAPQVRGATLGRFQHAIGASIDVANKVFAIAT